MKQPRALPSRIPEVVSKTRPTRGPGDPHPDVTHPHDLPFGGPRPPGKISIRQLYLAGIYDEILRWIASAEKAMETLASGMDSTGPPTLIFT